MEPCAFLNQHVSSAKVLRDHDHSSHSYRRAPKAAKSLGRRGSPRMDAIGTGIYAHDTETNEVRVVVFGATGYIGRYVVKEFIRQGYAVTAFARTRSGVGGKASEQDVIADFPGIAHVVFGDVMDKSSVRKAFETSASEPCRTTVVVSCLASRTGGIQDSQKIDYQATLNTLEVGREMGMCNHFILLSAVCVQKPLLEFQRAKLRFEAALQEAQRSDDAFSYSIVRPTAFFKSLAGQIDRLKQGNPYIMFEDGQLCKCNAISERDLAAFIVECASDVDKRNSVLPVGGPGEPVTPLQQARMIFRLIGKPEKYIRAPIGVMDFGIGVVDALSNLLPSLRDSAEFARIGRYYATEDMVGPSYGNDTLEDFFKNAIEKGLEGQELGDASVF
mmetsp:Transcript_398/g.670  ORF Transcript_398/g.670 Transcript_398/m.670 type:complete len:388 (-) Transcript_398:1297-2460(-)